MTLIQFRSTNFLVKMSRLGISLILSVYLVIGDIPLKNWSSAEIDASPVLHLKKGSFSPQNSFDEIMLKNMQKGKTYTGDSNTRLVLIQDLHCQEEAQLRISQAIRQVYQEAGISKVFLEGAQGEINAILYQAFPNESIRRQVAREFLKKGYLTGAEFALIEMGWGNGIELYGMEDTRLYLENLKAFRKTRQIYNELEKNFEEVEAWINQLKEKRYSKNLLVLDRVQRALHENHPDLQKIFKAIEKILLKNGETLKAWKNLALVRELLKLETELDQSLIRQELEGLVEGLQKVLLKDELQEIVSRALKYKMGQAPLSEYLGHLKRVYQMKPLGEFEKEYPHLEAWLNLTKRQESLKFDQVGQELNRLVKSLMKDDARKFNLKEEMDLVKKWELVKKFVKLELSREDLKELKVKSEALRLGKEIFDGMSNMKKKFPALNSVPSESPRLGELLKNAWRFYDLAQKRDEVLVKNALKKLRAKNNLKTETRNSKLEAKMAVLITGGFHTEGIQKILEKHGISYVTWAPQIRNGFQESRYEQIMMDEEYNLDKTEFSEKRLAWRSQDEQVKKMLSAPIVNAVWGAKGTKTKRVLLELLESMRTQLDRVRVRILQKMVQAMTDFTSLNEILNAWMGGEGNIELLKALSMEDFKLLFQALDPFQISLKLTDLDPKNKTQAEIAIKLVREAYGEKFPALVKLTEHYFDRSIASNKDVEKFFNTGGTNIPQINLQTSGNFSLAPRGTLSRKDGITNSEVGLQIKEVLDRIQLSPMETRLEGDILSFTVGQIKGRKEKDILGQLASFMRSPVYSAMDEDIRNVFETTRLVVLPNRVAIAENEKGASYAHYGETLGSTLFVGKLLLNYLLNNDPESLATLIKIEMNRKLYRQKAGSDQRSTREVVDQADVKNTLKLIYSITLANIEKFLLNYKNEESSSIRSVLTQLKDILDLQNDYINQTSVLAFDEILRAELRKEEINWEICESVMIALIAILKTRPDLFQENSFSVFQELLKKDFPNMDFALMVKSSIEDVMTHRPDLLDHVDENTILALRKKMGTNGLEWWQYVVPVYFFKFMAKNKVRTDIFDASLLRIIEKFFYKGANRLSPYLWDLLREIGFAQTELTFSPFTRWILLLPRRNVGDSLAHYELYENAHFKKALAIFKEKPSANYIYSVALAAYRLLRRYKLPLNENNIGKAAYIIVYQRNRASEIDVFAPEIPVINIKHVDEVYNNNDMESLEEYSGVKSITSFVGPDGKKDALDRIGKSRGPLTIFIRGHGGPNHLWLTQGMPGKAVSFDMETPDAISFQELGNALQMRRRLDEVRLVLDPCEAYGFIVQLLDYLKQWVDEYPVIVTSSNLGQWSYGDGILLALHGDVIDALEKKKHTELKIASGLFSQEEIARIKPVEIPPSPRGPVKIRDIFAAEEKIFAKQDFAVFVPVNAAEIKLFLDLPSLPETSSLQEIPSEKNAELSEPIVPQIPENILEVGAIFYPYHEEVKPKTFFGKILYWLGEPYWIAPGWEGGLFRLAALGLTGTTWESLKTLDPLGVGMAAGVSVGLLSTMHVFVKWWKDQNKPENERAYPSFGSVFIDFLKYLIPSTLFAGVYLLSLSLLSSLPFAPFIAFGMSAVVESLYNRFVISRRKETTSHVTEAARGEALGFIEQQSLEALEEAEGKKVKHVSETPTSGNFALTSEGVVTGQLGITNDEVGLQVKEVLDKVNLESTETRLEGDVLSFTVGKIKERKGDDLLAKLSAFLTNSTYSSLDEKTRSAFEDTRLIVLKDRISVAENERGASYAHYGEAGGSTVFIGGELLEELLSNDPESLTLLVRLEMNRRLYREKNGTDSRSSREVVRDVAVSQESMKKLTGVIAKAEAKEMMAKWTDQRIAQTIIKVSESLDKIGKQEAEIDDIGIGRLRGLVLDELVKTLSIKMEEKEKKQLELASTRIKGKSVLEAQEALVRNLRSAITSNVEAIMINPLLGDVQLYLGSGKTKSVKLDIPASQAISQMMGKRAGEVEQVFIDLRRNINSQDIAQFIQETIETLLEGEPLKIGGEKNLGTLHIEHLKIDGSDLIHVSRGTSAIARFERSPGTIRGFEFFEEALIKGTTPIAIDTELLTSLGESERAQLIWLYKNRLAISREEKVQGISGEDQERLWRNWDKYIRIQDDHKVVILSKDGMLTRGMEGSSVLRLEKTQIEGLRQVTKLASYIADVGKEKAKGDPLANEMLREVLKVLYEEGQIPQEIIEEMPLEKILADPEGFLFPPIKIVDVMDIESYLRAKKAVATMA